jgi:phenylacetate-coenzyme A ligase PaaK-like adenylate-forming protein
MQARSYPTLHGEAWPMSSSGSTGQPVKVTYVGLFAETNIPFNWRSQSWQDCDWSQVMVTRTQDFALREQAPADEGPWGPPSSPGSHIGRSVDLGKKTSPEEALRFIARLKPAYFTSGANTVHLYAMEARRLGLDIRFRATFSHAEAVTDAGRATVREVFGAPFYERYSSREAGRMAHEYSHHKGLHVNMERCCWRSSMTTGGPAPPASKAASWSRRSTIRRIP